MPVSCRSQGCDSSKFSFERIRCCYGPARVLHIQSLQVQAHNPLERTIKASLPACTTYARNVSRMLELEGVIYDGV